MGDKLTIFIGVTAAAVLLQMFILAAMFFALRKLSGRMQSMTEDLQSRLLPLLEDGKKLTADVHGMLETTRPKLDLILDNVSLVSTTARGQVQRIDSSLDAFMDRARLQGIRVDEMVTSTLNQVESTTAKVQHTVLSPLRHLNGMLQGIGVGVETFFEKQRRPRHGGQNDEMFI